MAKYSLNMRCYSIIGRKEVSSNTFSYTLSSYAWTADSYFAEDMEHKFVKVAINTDPQSSRLTRSHITDTKAIVVVDFFIDWTSDSNSAYSPKSKRFPKADTVKLESSAQGSSIDSSMAAVSAKFSQLNLAAEASPTPKLRQKSNAQPRVRHRSDPKAIEEKWTADEDAKLMELKNGKVVLWSDVANRFPNKSIGSLLQRHAALVLKGHSQPHASTSANSVSETNDVSAAAQMSRTAVESIDAKCGALTNSAAAAVGKTMQEHCGSTTPVPQAQSKTVDIIEDVAQIDSHDKTQSKDGEEHEAAEWGQWDVVEEENEPEWELVAA
ncbi:hypothetical protein EV356DRAFT_316396 [Viridothelium virens]|uniref:Myb-like domain-containing protein n=1 Tax=Viridothelium virens TaxID=1048519 RepID=A0A6A6GZA6_VIRVR|nr:hypothetical protein EV356DRAFT_316396 [Viridothelium virens]